MLGNAGQVVRPVYLPGENDVTEETAGMAPALPPGCVRRLSVPKPLECPDGCAGRQPDESCLCEIVVAAEARGVEWAFELDREGFWVYCGPAL